MIGDNWKKVIDRLCEVLEEQFADLKGEVGALKRRAEQAERRLSLLEQGVKPRPVSLVRLAHDVHESEYERDMKQSDAWLRSPEGKAHVAAQQQREKESIERSRLERKTNAELNAEARQRSYERGLEPQREPGFETNVKR